jgi:hypothetical protein
MPQLNGKKYAYTKKGKEQYKKDKKKKYTLSSAKKKLASMGRRGDTELEHVNKDEQRMLRRMGSARSKNPRTGLTENFNIVRAVQSAYDRNVKPIAKKVETEVKAQLPEGLDAENVGNKIGGVIEGGAKAAEFTAKELAKMPVNIVYGLAGETSPFLQGGGGSGSSSSTTTTSASSGGESGFGGMKRRKKRKKPGEAEGDSQGQNTQGGKMSKRGLRTPKRTGLNIVKKNSSSTSLGM